MLLPSAVFVNERAVVDIEVEAEKDVNVDFIDVRITGVQGWHLSNGNSTTSEKVTFPRLEKRVKTAGVLTTGRHDFSVAFTLPAGTAPTHEVSPAYSRLRIEVHASIPWWPDGRYTFVAPVRIVPPPGAQRMPRIIREPFHAEGDEPRIELALASSTLVAGETVLGTCAVFHIDDDKPITVKLAFEPFLRLFGGGHIHEQWGGGYRSTIELPAGSAGKGVPFRVALPPEIVPSFTTHTHEVTWFLTASVGSLFRTKLKAIVPLEILDARASDDLPKLTLVPRVADQRVLTVFEHVTRQRPLRLVATEDERFLDEQPAVVQDVAPGVEARVGYRYRGTDGTFLVGRARYPSLGIDLSVLPSTRMKEMLGDDIEVNVEEWDRVHRVDARDSSQAVPFLRELVPTPAIGNLVRWTDDEIVFEHAVTDVTPEAILEMLRGLEYLAKKLVAATRLIEPPSGLGVDLAAWRALAERCETTLCVGDLSFSGVLDAQPVEAGLVFDARWKPKAMRVHVGSARTASERAKETKLVLAHPRFDAPNVQPERVSALLATWSTDIIDLAVQQGVASASLPVTAGGVDATRVRDLIRTLRTLLASLDEQTGPYR